MAINLYSKASVDSLLSAKLSISSLTNAAATTLNATAPTTDQVLSFDGTELKWATVSGGGGAAWGGITGTLSSQTDLQNALDLKAPLASPTFTGTVTIPAGASISGYLTTASASSTYLAKASNLSDLANTGTARTNLGLGDLAVLNDAPSNGSQYARQNGAWAVVTGGGGGGGVDIQTFGSSTTSGTFTWTKPANAKWVEIYLVGGGGGAGSGARQATTVRRGGGGGGGGGAIFYGRIGAGFLASTETVVVGAGGTGGAGATLNSSNGTAGTAGVDTTFGPYKAIGGNAAGGGTSTAGGTNGTSRTSLSFFSTVAIGNGNVGGVGAANPGNPPIAYMLIPAGGAGGAGAEANQTFDINGAAGGGFSAAGTTSGIRSSVAGGAGATIAANATAGTSSTTQYIQAGTGGGSGRYSSGISNATFNGGNGGWPGGGGGGGGASDNGFTSGKGGNGGNGFAVIITYF